MAARYNGTTKEKCATILVLINDKPLIYDPNLGPTKGMGIPDTVQVPREDDKFMHGVDKGKWVYDVGWKRDKGPIILQEHDNVVDFKAIYINRDWLPTDANGNFDKKWQMDARPCERVGSSSSSRPSGSPSSS